MTKIKFLSEIVNNGVLPELKSSANSMNGLKGTISSLDIPDFSMSGYLRSLPGVMGRHINKCKNDIKLIETATNNFCRVNDECVSDIDKSEVYDIVDKDFHINV